MQSRTGTRASGSSTAKRLPKEGAVDCCFVAKTDTAPLVTKRMSSGPPMRTHEASSTLVVVSPITFVRSNVLMTEIPAFAGTFWEEQRRI